MSTQRIAIIFISIIGLSLFIAGCNHDQDSNQPTANNETQNQSQTETSGSSSTSTTQEPETTTTPSTDNEQASENNSQASVEETTQTEEAPDISNTPFKTDRAENDYFVFERIVPSRVVSGERITIGIRILAKQDLSLVAYSEQENGLLVLESGQLRNLSMGLSTGEVFEATYDVTVASVPGTVRISGSARTPSDDEDGGLTLISELIVVEG